MLKLELTQFSDANPASQVYALLLECNGWGVAGGILSSNRHCTGDANRGRSIRAGRSRLWDKEPVLLLGRPVDSRLGCEPESVCITPCPKIHAPTTNLRRV